MSARPRRVFGYARVSSEEQARGTSLADQQAAIAAHATSRGLTVARFFVEAESAVHEKLERRDQIRALLEDVREGDLILCALLDRWSRDMEFTLRTVREIKAKGAAMFFVGEQLDPSTEEGDSRIGMMAWAASEERKRIRRRMVGTRKLLRDRGYYVEGLPPFGYERSQPRGFKGAQKNVLVIVPERAELVKRMFALAIAGASLTTIGAELGLTRDRVGSSLRSRVYLGEVKNTAGEWMTGLHPAILDAATWARAQEAILTRRLCGARAKPEDARTATWLLRDVARCGLCGARMSSVYGHTQMYYRCAHRCTSAGVRVDAMEEVASWMIGDRLDELRLELARETPAPATPAVDHAAGRSRLEAKRARYVEAFADGGMTREEFRSALEKVAAERARIDAAEVSARPVAKRSHAEVVLHVKKLRLAWDHSTPQARRAIANGLLVSMGLTQGEEPVPEWRTVAEIATMNAPWKA